MPRWTTLTDSCLRHVVEHGILDNNNLKTLRLCSRQLRRVVNPILFYTLLVSRAKTHTKSVEGVVTLLNHPAGTMACHLTTLTIQGQRGSGKLEISILQLWAILGRAFGLRDVVLDTVRVTQSLIPDSAIVSRRFLRRFRLNDVSFHSPAVFVATFDVIGVMHHIVIQRPKYSVIRHVGAPTDAHDDFSGWSPMCNHLSVFAPHLQFMSHYTGSLDPSDMRMSMVEILHVVLHNASSRSLNRGLQLLPACGQLNTLRLYIIQTLLSERE